MTEVQRLSQQIGSTYVTYLAHDFREPVTYYNSTRNANDNESDAEAFDRLRDKERRSNEFWDTAFNIAIFMVAFAAAGVIYHGRHAQPIA